MKLHIFEFDEIHVAEARQRKNMAPEALLELAGSIAQVGLIHPVVVRRDDQERLVLVAGERRIRAMEYCWNFGQEVRCNGHVIPVNCVPCTFLGELDPVDAYEIEYEENVRRTDLSWQDRAAATAQLAQLKGEIAADSGGEPPTLEALANDLYGPTESGKPNYHAQQTVRQDIQLAQQIAADPAIAKAATRADALRMLDRKQKAETAAALGRRIGDELKGQHRLIRGDCTQVLPTLDAEQFDVILTDPPYGINAQEFGDSGGAGGSAGAHFYDDSPAAWQRLMTLILPEIYRVAKLQSHLYMFADIEHFLELREACNVIGWKCFRTPLIYHNPSAMRAPWPQSGPQRKYQIVLYANKGNKPVTALYSDVFTASPDSNLGHPAQKAVAAYTDLLRRSVVPGNRILDPFAGSGTIFPAAHAAKCSAVAVEMDEAACGIAAKRLEELQ